MGEPDGVIREGNLVRNANLGTGAKTYSELGRTDEPDTFVQSPERAHAEAKAGNILEILTQNATKSGQTELARTLRQQADGAEIIAGDTEEEIQKDNQARIARAAQSIYKAASSPEPQSESLTPVNMLAEGQGGNELMFDIYSLIGVTAEQVANSSTSKTDLQVIRTIPTPSIGGVVREIRKKTGQDNLERVSAYYFNARAVELKQHLPMSPQTPE